MRMPVLMIALGLTTYLLAPGASQSPLGSWPLTPAGVVALAAAIGVGMLARITGSRDGSRLGWAALLAVLVAGRVVLGFVDSPTGWLASYHANTDWSGRPEWSSDFRFQDATRIDRALSFSANEFPTHYLNGARFVAGVQREFSEPMSVEWTGVFDLPSAGEVVFDMRAAGLASLEIDGSTVSSDARGGRQRLAEGRHSIKARYMKPANADGEFRLALHDPNGNAIAVRPPASSGREGVATVAAAIDVIAIALLMIAAILAVRDAWASSRRVDALVAIGLVSVFAVQGFIAARPMIDRFRTLGGGDDWFGFESRARDVLEHGVLMTLGRPLGEGAAYFYHPFYSYVLAAVHAVAGESLFGPIFVHFLILAATAVIMWSFARELFGLVPATLGVVALVAIFEVDFIRYYTVTLLSENLYVLTVTLCLVQFAGWARNRSTTALIQAGAWAGISSVTRPAMMMFFLPALLVAWLMALRRDRGLRPLLAPLCVGVAWLGVVLPFTLRNWIVSRKLVLISDSLGGGFIVHNVPAGVDPQLYLANYSGGVMASIGVLWRLLVEHPAGVASVQLQKLGFTLGMVHWHEGYRPHPELVAITILYFVMLVMSKTLRRVELWPFHAFVASHWASMAMTSPWNYGYRLILPPYVYTSTLGVAAASALAWSKLRPVTAR